jgi:hypothetical protein
MPVGFGYVQGYNAHAAVNEQQMRVSELLCVRPRRLVHVSVGESVSEVDL